MLDEMKELALYTGDVGIEKEFPDQVLMLRLREKGSSFTNVRHAMEVVARHFLFSGGASFEDAALRSERVIGILRDWCGFAGGSPEDLQMTGVDPQVGACCRGWMKRYIASYREYNLSSGKMRPLDNDRIWRNWKKNEDGFEMGVFDRKRLSSSAINAVFYELVVANALRKGPLRRYCMVGKLQPEAACTSSTQKKDGTFAKLHVGNAASVLALTAMCLMGLEVSGAVPQGGFVPISLVELTAWLGLSKEVEHGDIESWLYNGEPVFAQAQEQSGVKQWKVSQRWLDDGQWQLLDITDSQEPLEHFLRHHEGEGFRCYVDADYDDPTFKMGSTKSLAVLPLSLDA